LDISDIWEDGDVADAEDSGKEDKMKKLVLPIILALSSVPLFALKTVSPIDNIVLNFQKASLSVKEKKDLIHMREEEKLARDVYLTLYRKWGLPVFKNISKSESWHMHMIKLLLDKYNLPDPVIKTGDKIGVFENQKLHRVL
jgi:hypothetical protein